MRTHPVLLGVLVLLSLGIARGARSAPILDQAFAPTSAFMYAELRDGLTRAQTFTVGVGGVLTGFDVYLSTPGVPGAAVTFQIYRTIGGVPDLASPALAGADIVLADLAENALFYAADISGAGLVVAPGEVYALVTKSPAGVDPATWRGAYDDDLIDVAHYANGTAFGQGWTASVVALPGDLGFRTYVDPGGPSPVPEPACLLMIGAGLAGLAVHRRRRRRA